MLEYQRKKQIRRYMYSKGVLVLMFICICFLAKGAYAIHSKVAESAKDKEIAKKQLALLTARDEMVTAQINDLMTEQGIEKEIREKFNVAKEGESMIVIVDSPKKGDAKKEDGVFDTVWNKIKSVFN